MSEPKERTTATGVLGEICSGMSVLCAPMGEGDARHAVEHLQAAVMGMNHVIRGIEMLRTRGPAADALTLAQAMIGTDGDKSCPHCTKDDWSKSKIEHGHDAGCPYALAYNTIANSAEDL